MKLYLMSFLLLVSRAVMASEEGGLTFDVIVEQIGKFHPLVLHFPAAIIPLTFIVVFVSKYIKGQEFWRKTIPYFIHAGTLTSIPAAAFGYLLSTTYGELEGTILWHKYFAFTLTTYMIGLSIYTIISKEKFNTETSPSMKFLILTGIAAALIALTGHFGGTTTHGELFILQEYL